MYYDSDGFLERFENNKREYFKDMEWSIVFELTERRDILDDTKYFETLDYLRRRFYRLAIDDLGQGFNKPDIISDINPHFIKLKMYMDLKRVTI